MFELIVLNGLTIAPGPVAVFGQHTQSDHLETQRILHPSPEGHYF